MTTALSTDLRTDKDNWRKFPASMLRARADVIDWLQALHDHLSDRDLNAGQSMPTRFRTRLADVLRRLQLGEDLEVMQ